MAVWMDHSTLQTQKYTLGMASKDRGVLKRSGASEGKSVSDTNTDRMRHRGQIVGQLVRIACLEMSAYVWVSLTNWNMLAI